jgi:hypothetical protein
MPFLSGRQVIALRLEHTQAECEFRKEAQREAVRLVQTEREQWREAREACFAFDRIRPAADARLNAILGGNREQFPGEGKLAEMAICDADKADARYTVICFANRHDRLRCLRGGPEREAVIREAVERGGVYTETCGGRHFQEIAR